MMKPGLIAPLIGGLFSLQSWNGPVYLSLGWPGLSAARTHCSSPVRSRVRRKVLFLTTRKNNGEEERGGEGRGNVRRMNDEPRVADRETPNIHLSVSLSVRLCVYDEGEICPPRRVPLDSWRDPRSLSRWSACLVDCLDS